MKIRLADYIANFIVENGIKHGFSVVGGGAMHLNDAFGHKKGLTMYYNHHEQASAIAAEAYARLNNEMALVCVTTGPGGINALNGVCSAYLDSLPMFVVSGQVRYDTSARYEKKLNGACLRSLGDQEFDIVESVKNMTKYAVSLENPMDIKYVLEKAFHIATTGRMGPVWIDIPVNFQGMEIDTTKLKGYRDSNDKKKYDSTLPKKIDKVILEKVYSMILNAKRPIIYAGNGVRLSGAYDSFKNLINKLNIPVATYWDSIDLIETNDKLYCGRGGNMGDRAGNFAIQNSDLVIAIGTRLSIRQVGYNYKDWARKAKVIMIDIDKEEFKKHTLHIDYKVWADAKNFIDSFLKYLTKEKLKKISDSRKNYELDWNKQCILWKNKYKVCDDAKKQQKGKVNVYSFIDKLSSNLKNKSLTVVSNGACCVAGHQTYVIKNNSRFYNNNAIASMGYGLPASIGACISYGKKETICLEGDGSIMMNLQELQTVITNKLPIKIFLINNEGYHSIRITQNSLFSEHSKVGIGKESRDLSFPDYEKIANAFGFKYVKISKNEELDKKIKDILKIKGAVFVEVFTDTKQVWEPKSSAKRLKDGTMVSSPLEDMAPFLSREELKSNLFI